MTRNTRWYLGTAIVLAGLYLLDRFTKNLVLSRLHEPIDLIPGIFGLQRYGNTDFLYVGLVPYAATITVIVLVMLLLLYLAAREYAAKHHWHVSLLGLILVGAFSNLLDRVRYGAVIDFLTVPNWSVFNLSDLYIVAGVGTLLVLLWRKDRAGRPAHPTQPSV